MNHESMRHLRLDRRLVGRRGWIAPDELARELEALPDVAHKAAGNDSGSPPKPAGDGGEVAAAPPGGEGEPRPPE